MDIVGESKYSTFIIKGVTVALVFHGASAVRRVPNFSGICVVVALSKLYKFNTATCTGLLAVNVSVPEYTALSFLGGRITAAWWW